MPNSRLHIQHYVIDSLPHHYQTVFLVKLPKFLLCFSGKGVYTQELSKNLQQNSRMLWYKACITLYPESCTVTPLWNECEPEARSIHSALAAPHYPLYLNVKWPHKLRQQRNIKQHNITGHLTSITNTAISLWNDFQPHCKGPRRKKIFVLSLVQWIHSKRHQATNPSLWSYSVVNVITDTGS